jgi:DNA-binding LacI/PurR family transcriptional regulator
VVQEDRPVRVGDFGGRSRYWARSSLLQGEPMPTVIFAANNRMTIGAMASAAYLGPKVPEDVSVVGFDDITLASCVRPELTTVSVTGNKRGEAAPRLVLRPLAGKDCLRTTCLSSSSLVVGNRPGSLRTLNELDETKAERRWSGG